MGKQRKVIKLNADTVRAFLALGSFIITFIIGCFLLYGIFNDKIPKDNKEILESVKYVFAFFRSNKYIDRFLYC